MNLKFITNVFLSINFVLSAKVATDSSQNKNLVTSGISIPELNNMFQTKEWKKCQFPIAFDAKSGKQISYKQFLKNHTEDEVTVFTEKNFDESVTQLYQLLGCKYVEVVWLSGNVARHMTRSCQLYTDAFTFKECMESFSTTLRKTQSTIREMINILEIFTPNVSEKNDDVLSEHEITEDESDTYSIGSLFSDSQSEENDSDEDFYIYKLEDNSYDAPRTPEEIIEIHSEPKNIIKFYRFEIIDSIQSNTSIDTVLEKIDQSNNNAFRYLNTRCTPRKKMQSDLSRFLGNYKNSLEKTINPTSTIEFFKNILFKYCKSVSERYLIDTGLIELLSMKKRF